MIKIKNLESLEIDRVKGKVKTFEIIESIKISISSTINKKPLSLLLLAASTQYIISIYYDNLYAVPLYSPDPYVFKIQTFSQAIVLS